MRRFWFVIEASAIVILVVMVIGLSLNLLNTP